MYEFITPKTKEDIKLGLIIKGLIETTPNDYVAGLQNDDVLVLMNAERVEGDSYYELDNEFTINDCLCGKCIIEFPIFNVIPKGSKGDWNICSPFTVAKTVEQEKKEDEEREKANMEEDSNEKQEVTKGPDFDEIKKSLKLDLIASFNQEMEEAAQKK